MSLIETFENMKKEAQVDGAEQETANEEMELINKYAEWAENTLLEERGEGNFEEKDVIKLATEAIQADSTEAYQREKVAEAYELGQIMYAGFKDAANADNEE